MKTEMSRFGILMLESGSLVKWKKMDFRRSTGDLSVGLKNAKQNFIGM